MSDIKLCKECWHWIAPKYAARPGKCALGVYDKPYEDTRACDEMEDKFERDCVNVKEGYYDKAREQRT